MKLNLSRSLVATTLALALIALLPAAGYAGDGISADEHKKAEKHEEHAEKHEEHAEKHEEHAEKHEEYAEKHEEHEKHAEHVDHNPQDHGALAASRNAYLHNWDDASKKLVDLAEAIPADKYGWRPAEGVRSVSEVFGHVALANYFIPASLGIEPPEGVGRDLEQETDKAKVIAALRGSLAHARAAAEAADAAKLSEEITFFGQEGHGADLLLVLLTHTHEHLGQAIAYARANGVVPPWSGGGGDG